MHFLYLKCIVYFLYGKVNVKILMHIHFLTLRMWSKASLPCPNFLGGATGDWNKSGNAFIRAIDCCAVKKQDKKVIFKKVV
jgi:hypothetical protein